MISGHRIKFIINNSMQKSDLRKSTEKKGAEWEMEKLDSVLKTIDFF